MPREQDVVADHLQIAGASHLPERQPHFQRPEAPRILRAVVEVVHDLIVEVVIGRVIREGVAQLFGIAHEHAAGFERRVEPLVRIHRDRIGLAQRAQARRRSRRLRRQRAVGAVDVKPQPVFAADRGDLRERIDGAGADRARGADDEERLMAEPEILARSGGAAPTGPSAAHRRWQSSGSRRCRARTDRRLSGSTCGFPSTRRPAAAAVARQPLLSHVPRRPSPRARRRSRRSSPCCRR